MQIVWIYRYYYVRFFEGLRDKNDFLIFFSLFSVNEESKSSLWSDGLQKTNNQILQEEKKMVSLFTRLSSYIKIIGSLGEFISILVEIFKGHFFIEFL